VDIILLKDHEDLGSAGDELKVKDGYARNYLIPQGIAVQATSGMLKQLEKMRLERRKQREEEISAAQEKARKLKDVVCTISVETGEGDKLFGAVTAASIAEALEGEGIDLLKKQILLESPLNSLGVFTVKAKLHPEVKTSFRISVVKK